MSPLWRGFAGLIAVFFLAYYVTNLENEIEDEKALIASDPTTAAIKAFKEEEITFYQAWLYRLDQKGQQIGYWFLPGEKEIPTELLNEYTNRKNLEHSDGIQISQGQERYNRKAIRWAAAYNIHLASLLEGTNSNQPEQDNPIIRP